MTCIDDVSISRPAGIPGLPPGLLCSGRGAAGKGSSPEVMLPRQEACVRGTDFTVSYRQARLRWSAPACAADAELGRPAPPAGHGLYRTCRVRGADDKAWAYHPSNRGLPIWPRKRPSFGTSLSRTSPMPSRPTMMQQTSSGLESFLRSNCLDGVPTDACRAASFFTAHHPASRFSTIWTGPLPFM